jgi:hypothetical protein
LKKKTGKEITKKQEKNATKEFSNFDEVFINKLKKYLIMTKLKQL